MELIGTQFKGIEMAKIDIHLGFTFRVGDVNSNQYSRVDVTIGDVDTDLPIEDQFKTLNNYSTNPQYFDLLYNSYKKRISPISQTNKMFQGEKSLGDQMNKLKLPVM